jgi:NAD(P)-dependent dehydrogenase (short-subunit alcohol dehydrogenase family)
MPLGKETALITGAAGGIGAATAALFRARGYTVIGVDRCAQDRAHTDHFIQADVSNATEVRDLFSALPVDSVAALVNNAGVQICKPLAETSVEDWDCVVAANLRSVFLMTRHCLPLLTRNSAIVNVSSVHAAASSAHMGAYAASKGGILSLSRALAVELADRGIRVNALLPGAVDTPMLHAGLDRGTALGASAQQCLTRLKKRTLQRRLGDPVEIAEAIHFLANPAQSSFVTGHALAVDGGALARLSTE